MPPASTRTTQQCHWCSFHMPCVDSIVVQTTWPSLPAQKKGAKNVECQVSRTFEHQRSLFHTTPDTSRRLRACNHLATKDTVVLCVRERREPARGVAQQVPLHDETRIAYATWMRRIKKSGLSYHSSSHPHGHRSAI